MALNIVVNNKFTIISDSRNYILEEYAIAKKGKHTGEKYVVGQTYYSSIKALLEGLTDLSIKTSNATSFMEVKAVLVDLQRLYEKFYNELKGDKL